MVDLSGIYIVDDNKYDKITLARVCPCCGREQTMTFHRPTWERGILALNSGARVQDAFPSFNADEREFFMTGICAECWDKM